MSIHHEKSSTESIAVAVDSTVDSQENDLTTRQWSEEDRKYVLRPWAHPQGEPVCIASAKGCEITDVDGKQFIDFTSGYFVNNAGHCHPTVVAAATEQMQSVMQVSGKHTTQPAIQLAKQLVTHAPTSIDKVFYATGGSEANEFALKMARQYTGQSTVGYLKNGYHGLTLGALETCASKKYRDTAGVPLGSNVFELPTAYCYRCPHQNNCQVQCLDTVEETIDALPTKPAAIIAEPVQAVGGIIPPKQWWTKMDGIRRSRNMLLIIDEIQTGLGRTGTMFASEHYDLEPDILTAGKGLSGGVGSLAVAMVSQTVGKNFYGGTTPTSGGNAVSAAAGLGLIQAIREDDLLGNCRLRGQYFSEALWGIPDPWIGDVRFKGLLGGVELVIDRDSKQPLPKDLVMRVKDKLHADGMLITVSGPFGNCLRLQPPLCISNSQLDSFTASLAKALQSTRQQKATA